MADSCAIQTVEKYSELDVETLNNLEAELRKIEKAYADKPNAKQAKNKEVEELMNMYIENEKYTSINIINNKIKEARIEQGIFEGIDFSNPKKALKESGKRLLNLFEGNNGVETTFMARGTKYINMLRSGLLENGKGFTDEFYSGQYDDLIHQQAYNKANNLPDVDNANAVKMYEVIKKVNNVIYNDLLAAGLNVKYRNDFLVGRSYNADKLKSMSKEEWVSDMLDNHVDLKNTFSESTLATKGEAEKIMGNMYDEIIESQRAFAIPELQGDTKSAAMRLKGRKIEFRDGSSEYQVFQKYGGGRTLGESMQYQMDKSAKAYANSMILGTNPEQTHAKLMDTFSKKFSKDVETNEINKVLSNVNKAYQEVVRPPMQPSTKFQKAVNLLRGLQSFTKLGSSIFAAMWDTNSTSLMYSARSGAMMYESYAKSIKKFTDVALASGMERKELARLFNVNTYFNDAAVALGGHKGDYDTGFDKLNRFFSSAQKWTGVPFQTEMSRVTGALMQADLFTNMVDNIGKLNNFQKRTLEKFKISEDELAFIKKHAKREKGYDVYAPMAILDIPNEAFDSNSLAAIKKKNKLFDKYANLIDDAVSKGTPTPRAKVKRHLMKDRSRDELTRNVFSLVVQFKETAWQIALANKEALDDYRVAGGDARAAFGVMEYMTFGFSSYMAIETAKATIFGDKTPWEKIQEGDEKELKEMFKDYINKSSVLPLISDAVIQGTSPYFGNDIVSYAAGPTIGGTLPDLMDIARYSDKEKATRRFVKRNILPSNNILIKGVTQGIFEHDLIMNEKIRK